MSIHIGAKKEDIASRVIMSGNPLRMKYIAEKFLENPVLINEVRGMLGYTGYYKGERITVMAHGMGIPSAGIYTYELFNEYGVETIIRLGTAGSYDENYEIGDIVISTESYSNSAYLKNMTGELDDIISADKEINKRIEEISKKEGINIKEARVHSSDNFYTDVDIKDYIRDVKECSIVEMETFAIFANARRFNKKASSILTISDSFITNKIIPNEILEKNMDDMIRLGLETIITL